MKAITIKQPYATLIAEGIKQYEFRTWPTKYRGELLIHAGKSIDKEAMKKYESFHLDYPSGKIIAKVNLIDCVEIDDEQRKILNEKNKFVYEHAINNHDKKLYGFVLNNVQRVKQIEIDGRLSLWNYDGKVEDLK